MEKQVRAHYHSDNLANRIFKAVKSIEKKSAGVTLKDLAPIDQLHTGGAKATRSIIEKAGLEKGLDVLDAGCGVGGSSRLMAKDHDFIVTGIDLSAQFIDVASALTETCSLSDQVYFQCGSLLDMPFADQSFDAILCQHVLMNIQDKRQVLKEFYRVLRKGGTLIFHEVVKGENEPVMYPVPWAGEKEVSCLESREDLVSMIQASGFKAATVFDGSEQAGAWWARVKKKAGAQPLDKNRLGPHLIFGDSAVEFGKTMSYNLKWNRIRVMEAVFIKEG